MKATVVEGSQYRVGKMTLAGSVDAGGVCQKAGLKPGDIANQDMLRRSLLALSRPYRMKGYLRAKISAVPRLDPSTHTVDYAIDVVPGEVYHLGKLDLENLSTAQQAKFLSAWKMQAGDPYDESYTSSFLLKNAAALHDLDGMSASYKQFEHEDTQVVDLLVSFQKGGALN